MNYYNNVDLSMYIMNDNEKKKAKQIIKKIKDKVFDEEVNTFGLFDIKIGYAEKIGYYALMTNSEGDYELLNEFPTISESVAIMNIVFNATCNQGFEYEYNYRKDLKKIWKEDYPNIPYDGRKYAFEYSLKKLKRISNYVSSSYVDVYLQKLNKKNNIWKYDTINVAFVENI